MIAVIAAATAGLTLGGLGGFLAGCRTISRGTSLQCPNDQRRESL